MQKSLPNDIKVGLVPSSYYDAIEGAREVRENILDLAKRVITVLQERIDFQGV
jgi:hypothetical protein